VAFNERTQQNTESLKETLYSTVSLLCALDKSSDYVGAALNDGVEVGVEMDERPFDAFVHLSRLEVLSALVRKLTISDKQKQQFLGHITKALADKTIEAMTIGDKTASNQKLLRAYHAVVKPTATENESANDGRKLGVTRSRL